MVLFWFYIGSKRYICHRIIEKKWLIWQIKRLKYSKNRWKTKAWTRVRVVDDENMDEMVESIKEYGVLVPAIAMDKYKNGYEITSFPAESFDGGVNGYLRKGDMMCTR